MRQINVFLNYIATYVPETVVSNKEIIENSTTWDEAKVFDKLGFKERRVSKSNEYSSDLAIEAVNNLKQKTSLDDIEFILYCTQSPDYLIPSNAFLLHNHFKFSKKVGALDFNLGCSGYVYGLGMAKALILSGQARKVLLVTSETYSKLLDENDISNKLIFGDGASASIVSSEHVSEDSLTILNFKYGTDGSGWDKLKSGIGGVKRHFHPEAPEKYLKMNGQEVLLFTLREVPEVIKEMLEANNISSQDEIQHFVFHQANKFVIDQITKKMKLNPARVRNHMESYSNTVSATIPIVLENMLTSQQIKKNDKVALVGFGVGFSWAGTLLIKE